jgi:hypothetical protein
MPVHSRSSAVAPESYLDEGNDDTLHFKNETDDEEAEEKEVEDEIEERKLRKKLIVKMS